MTESILSPLVERALRFAARCHTGQSRKGSDVPYFTHPMAVTLILVREGFDDEDLLAAALLHDVVEDTPCTREELAEQFPPPVVEYVAHLTEHKRDADGKLRPWEDRKHEHLAQIPKFPQSVRAIMLADKLHNLSTMLFDQQAGTEVWQRFNAPRDRLLWYYRAAVQAAAGRDERLQPLARQCLSLLQQLHE